MTARPAKLVSLRISTEDYVNLERQAASLGVKPAVFARLLVRLGLNSPATAGRRHNRRQVADALARLDKRAAGGRAPQVDAVELIRRARDERGQRIARAAFTPDPGE
jgi:hypothetical protein